jgi:hypothetical protein
VAVAQVAADFECRRWGAPGHPLPIYAQPELVPLCDELGLGLCFLHDGGAWEAAQKEFLRLHGVRLDAVHWRIEPTSLPIPTTKSLTDFSERDRRVACAWLGQHRVQDPDVRWGQPICRDGQQCLTFAEWPKCVADFPRCPVRLEEILPCMLAALDGDAAFPNAPPEAKCLARVPCMWGISRTCRKPSGFGPC